MVDMMVLFDEGGELSWMGEVGCWGAQHERCWGSEILKFFL